MVKAHLVLVSTLHDASDGRRVIFHIVVAPQEFFLYGARPQAQAVQQRVPQLQRPRFVNR